MTAILRNPYPGCDHLIPSTISITSSRRSSGLTSDFLPIKISLEIVGPIVGIIPQILSQADSQFPWTIQQVAAKFGLSKQDCDRMSSAFVYEESDEIYHK